MLQRVELNLHTDYLSWDDKVLYEPFQPEPIYKVQRSIHFQNFCPDQIGISLGSHNV